LAVNSRISGFRGEFLWELDIAQAQLLALGDALPAENYGYRPAEDARSFSQVLVHVAAGNLLLLRLAGILMPGSFDPYGSLEGNRQARFVAAIRRNLALEKTSLDKQQAMELLRNSFEIVRNSVLAASDLDLERTGEFFGEKSTVRRVLLRILVHSHEHMGQAVAYARSCQIKAPWPDPLSQLDQVEAGAPSLDGTPQPSQP